MLFWVIIALILILVLAALYHWLFTITEGVYLGRRLVVWLYDVTAHKYDRIKQYDAADERILVVEPILGELPYAYRPLLLDVATGTGRVPYFLLADGRFQKLLDGRLVCLDASRGMLAHAVANVAPYAGRVDFVQQLATPLPFPEAVFEGVTCLESLEFFPSAEAALAEMVRVLKPGGFLMVTRRRGWEAKTFVGRYLSQEDFVQRLHALGLTDAAVFPWQSNYDLVVAQKPAG